MIAPALALTAVLAMVPVHADLVPDVRLCTSTTPVIIVHGTGGLSPVTVEWTSWQCQEVPPRGLALRGE